jgi:integrase
MNTQISKAWGLSGVDLPEVVKLRSGALIDPKSDRWMFIDGVRAISLDFNQLPQQVNPLKDTFKRVLINVFEENSPAYATIHFYAFRHLAEVIAESSSEVVTEIQAIHIVNFISKYKDNLGAESRLSAILTRWTNLGLAGFSEEAVSLLKSRRKPGNVKGEAVRTLDPVNGPLNDYELQEFTAALNEAYAQGTIEEGLFYLTWLVALTGQRVSQYCSLKVMDVMLGQAENGELKYEIQIPTAKQRDEVLRESFLTRPLPTKFGESLLRYAERVQAEYPELDKNAPLFPTRDRRTERLQLNSNFKYHWESVSLSRHFTHEMGKISPISPRTHEPMHLAIGRFRDTIGTRAAQEGYGELVIAEILGHVDTQNVGAYVAVIPEIAQRLDKILAKDLAPIANAFLGKVLLHEGDATRAGDPTSHIIDYKNSKKSVGSCGTTYDCKFNAPIACYTCRNFEAWIDAPHEALLDNLLSERERLLKTSGQRVASINDRTIVAIQAVIDECVRLRDEGAFSNA